MRYRRGRGALLGALVLAVLAPPGAAVGVPGTAAATAPEFSVLAADGVPAARVAAAARAAGGTVERVNDAVGLLTVRAPQADRAAGFAERLGGAAGVLAVAPVEVIGRVPALAGLAARLPAVPQAAVPHAAVPHAAVPGSPGPRPAGPRADPLDGNLWGLTAIHADRARKRQDGDKRVLVGVIDTGIDGRHPDIAPNFDRKRSRNFTHDIPFDSLGARFDGPCEVRSCVDPADVDDGGHGTHVAGTIAAAVNGRGVSGVAPGVTLVNLRAGQDSGFFLLQSVVDALTYAGDIGVDVVNMSFFLDPWVFNCPDNAADTAAQKAVQKVTLIAMARATRYAAAHGVTQVGAYGNDGMDAERDPQVDLESPDIADAGAVHPRVVDRRSCKILPQDLPEVLNIGAVGPSGAKAGYSTYGARMVVSAPGGWTDDYAGTPEGYVAQNRILSTWPRGVAKAEGMIDGAGLVTPAGDDAGLVRECTSTCAYYLYAEGTSMATPHAAGVAALIVSQYGRTGSYGKGLGMRPADVRRILIASATHRACGNAATELLTYGGTCSGSASFNTFYGHGTVDAYAAVTR